ncbi:MAG: GNAT family N-acetyltransferase [Firmicutes bacterium]|nr:GNAT family N-acetyltransferase [Bacillota bacterium]MBR6969472.1 GNAT family N-acetyltransferase [Bacillota bacterium]
MQAPTLTTKDLILRPSAAADLQTFSAWERIPAVTEFFSIRDGQTLEEITEKFRKDHADPGAAQLTICLKDGTPIGRVVMADIIEGWKAELWRIYVADTALRGKGYGKQAMQAVMKWCFEDLKLERLYLDHYTGNPAAGLYLSLGFQYEGVLRRNCRKNGKLYDVHLMSMLKEEYEALQR